MGYLHHCEAPDGAVSTPVSRDPMRHFKEKPERKPIPQSFRVICEDCGKDLDLTRDPNETVGLCGRCKEARKDAEYLASLSPYRLAVEEKRLKDAWGLLPDPCYSQDWDSWPEKCRKPALKKYLADMVSGNLFYLEEE